MKIVISLLSSLLLFLSPLTAQQKVFPYQDQEKWGIVDESGEIILKPTYDFIWFFQNHDQEDAFAFFQQDNKQGVLNRQGKVRIRAKFDQLDELGKSPYLVYKVGDKYGFYHRLKRKKLSKPIYDRGVRPLTGDGKWVRIVKDKREGLWAEGKVIIPPRYDYVQLRSQGDSPTFSATLGDTIYHFSNRGKLVGKQFEKAPEDVVVSFIDLEEDIGSERKKVKSPRDILKEKVGKGIRIHDMFRDPKGEWMAIASKNGKWGFVGWDGKPFIPLDYTKAMRPYGHYGAMPILKHFGLVTTEDGTQAYVDLRTGQVYLPK